MLFSLKFLLFVLYTQLPRVIPCCSSPLEQQQLSAGEEKQQPCVLRALADDMQQQAAATTIYPFPHTPLLPPPAAADLLRPQATPTAETATGSSLSAAAVSTSRFMCMGDIHASRVYFLTDVY